MCTITSPCVLFAAALFFSSTRSHRWLDCYRCELILCTWLPCAVRKSPSSRPYLLYYRIYSKVIGFDMVTSYSCIGYTTRAQEYNMRFIPSTYASACVISFRYALQIRNYIKRFNANCYRRLNIIHKTWWNCVVSYYILYYTYVYDNINWTIVVLLTTWNRKPFEQLKKKCIH